MLIVSNFNGSFGVSLWTDNLEPIKKIGTGYNFTGACKQTIDTKQYRIWFADNYSRRLMFMTEKFEIFDSGFLLPNPGTHGMTCINNNTIIACDTRFDRIIAIDIESLKITDEWIMSTGKKDNHHINGISYSDGRLLISCFGLEALQEGQRWKTKVGCGTIIDITSWYSGNGIPIVIESNISLPHSVISHNNQTWYVESATGSLKCYQKTRFKTPSFLRGLSFSPSCIFIGSSAVRKHGIIDFDNVSKLFKLKKNFELNKQVTVEPEYGEIFDVIWVENQ